MGEQKEAGITWCDYTFNPWWGCTKVSPACDHCYAEAFARRVGYSATGKHFPIWGKGANRRAMSGDHWRQLGKWNLSAASRGQARTVFVGSMCDVMEEHAPVGCADIDLDAMRARLYEWVEVTKSLNYLLLTKRPQNFKRYLPTAWLEKMPSNVWLMTTVESEEQAWRIDELCKIRAAVRGISYEPALGPVDWLKHHKPNWIIAGGESGPGARPSDPQWYRETRDICRDFGIPFHFKQWGNWSPLGEVLNIAGIKAVRRVNGDVETLAHGMRTGKLAPVSSGQWMERVPAKHDAGRLLDGVKHDNFPTVAPG